MFIIIAGAGTVGYRIVAKLVQNKHDVVVIDKDRDVCENLYSETGATTINGDATKLRVLKDAGASKADSFVCLMRNDADNIACALLAKSLGVEDIISRVRRPQYKKAYQIAGINGIVDISRLLVNRIIEEVEKPEVKRIFTMGDGKTGVYAILMKKNSQAIGMTIRDIVKKNKFPDDCLFMGVYKNNMEDFFIPRGNFVIQENDTVFVVSNSQYIKQASDFLTKTVKQKKALNNPSPDLK